MTDRSTRASRSLTASPLVQLTLARVREFFREPEAIFWTFLFPIVISLALALAFPSNADRPVVVGVAPGAADVRNALGQVAGVTVREVPEADQQRALREGGIHLLVLPTEPPTYRFDPARPESRVARAVVDEALQRRAGRSDAFRAREEPVQIAGSRYIDWFIPGLVGLSLMSNGMWGVGFPVTQARMRNLMKRMVASPMRRRDYLLAQMIARLLGVVPEVALPLTFGALAFDLPINGSWLAIGVVGVIGALTFAAMGLLLASRARTFEAISGLMNLGMIPMWILSGVFFSASNFPDAFQPVIQALPLTAVNDALRSIVLDGASLSEVASEIAILLGWGTGSFALALRMFRWR
jgi:ABC-type multidrug transport system permease subunit